MRLGRRVRLGLIGVVGLGASVAMALPVVVHAASITVCASGCNYSTIQAAVNAANPGDTVAVAAGTYNENVSIGKALTLQGPNHGVRGAGTRGAEANVRSMFISAGHVSIDGFSFYNAGSQVQVLSTSPILSGIIVENNIFSGYSNVGVPTNDAGDLLVTRNLFKNALPNSEAMQIKGITDPSPILGGCNGTVVSDNVFMAATNNSGAEVNFSCTGTHSSNVSVVDNVSTGIGGPDGPSFTAFDGVDGGIVIHGNNVTGTATAGSAIFFFGGVTGSVDISNNVITGFASGNGVSVWSLTGANSGTFTFTHNDLSHNFRSIRLTDAFSSGATVAFHRNDLSGNTSNTGAQNESSSLAADGACNWWGAPTGPTAATNPGGTGNAAVGRITFKPWLLSANLDGACIGGNVPTSKDQCKNDGWETEVRQDGSTFKNQGDCIQYVNTGK